MEHLHFCAFKFAMGGGGGGCILNLLSGVVNRFSCSPTIFLLVLPASGFHGHLLFWAEIFQVLGGHVLSALVTFSPGTGHSYFLAFSEGLEEVDKRKK